MADILDELNPKGPCAFCGKKTERLLKKGGVMDSGVLCSGPIQYGLGIQILTNAITTEHEGVYVCSRSCLVNTLDKVYNIIKLQFMDKCLPPVQVPVVNNRLAQVNGTH